MKYPTLQLATAAASLALSTGHVSAAEFPDFTELVELYSPAVVSINATGERSGPHLGPPPGIPEDSPFYEYFKRFFEQEPEFGPPSPLASKGSGFIISADGLVLTNAHVLEGANEVLVGLSDRSELKAEVVGADPRSDVALLKVDADNLPTVKIGDPSTLKVGQWVLAIGSPFGFDYTATQGIISSLGRNLPSGGYVSFIQTDAAVNPGNSGGPLFNLNGEVIGVNSQIYTRSGGYQGVSFAIPIDVAMDVAEQLKTTGRVSRGWLGVMIQEVTSELAESFGLDKPKGALVGQVLVDSPAEAAGLAAGDIIVAFNDQPVGTSRELPPMVGRIRPGKAATVTVIRDGKEQVLTVTIEELPDDLQKRAYLGGARNRLKLKVSDLPAELRSETKGVSVNEVEEDGPAGRAGIQPGDIIVRLNNKDVIDTNQFEALVKELPEDKPLPVLVQRGEGALFLALTIPSEE
jgi:serine protease Do